MENVVKIEFLVEEISGEVSGNVIENRKKVWREIASPRRKVEFVGKIKANEKHKVFDY